MPEKWRSVSIRTAKCFTPVTPKECSLKFAKKLWTDRPGFGVYFIQKDYGLGLLAIEHPELVDAEDLWFSTTVNFLPSDPGTLRSCGIVLMGYVLEVSLDLHHHLRWQVASRTKYDLEWTDSMEATPLAWQSLIYGGSFEVEIGVKLESNVLSFRARTGDNRPRRLMDSLYAWEELWQVRIERRMPIELFLCALGIGDEHHQDSLFEFADLELAVR